VIASIGRYASLARVALPVATLVSFASATHAQRATAYLDSAIVAYDDVRYGDATRLLRVALDVRGTDSLATSEQSTALMYLVASEYFSQRTDSATAAALRLVKADRAYVPDSLTFPPAVLSFYTRVREKQSPATGRGDTLVSNERATTGRTNARVSTGDQRTTPPTTRARVDSATRPPTRTPPAARTPPGTTATRGSEPVSGNARTTAARSRAEARETFLAAGLTVIAAVVVPALVAPGETARPQRFTIALGAVVFGAARLVLR
jgi:hypothetical protein